MVHSHFIDNIWGADLVDVQLTSKLEFLIFLLCVIDTYSKFTWVIRLKDKRRIAITNAFQKNLVVSKCKPNKMLADKASEFHNRSIKLSFKNNDIFIRTLRNKIYKYITSIS